MFKNKNQYSNYLINNSYYNMIILEEEEKISFFKNNKETINYLLEIAIFFQVEKMVYVLVNNFNAIPTKEAYFYCTDPIILSYLLEKEKRNLFDIDFLLERVNSDITKKVFNTFIKSELIDLNDNENALLKLLIKLENIEFINILFSSNIFKKDNLNELLLFVVQERSIRCLKLFINLDFINPVYDNFKAFKQVVFDEEMVMLHTFLEHKLFNGNLDLLLFILENDSFEDEEHEFSYFTEKACRTFFGSKSSWDEKDEVLFDLVEGYNFYGLLRMLRKQRSIANF